MIKFSAVFSFVFFLFCKLMYSNERYSSFQNDDDKQHLSDVNMQKLRSVIKTKIAGELTISEKQNFKQDLILYL